VKLLVTGATGFLGSTLVPMLLEAGHEVRALVRSGAQVPGAEAVKGDVRDVESLRRALAGVEGLYHLAGLVSRDPADSRKMYELHVDGTRNLLVEAQRAGLSRVVLASSSGTIGVSRTRRAATEEDDYPIETVGRWPYYLSKIYEEKIAIEFARRGLPVVILNPSLLLGPGDVRMSSTQDIFRFLMGRIPVMPRGGISFVDVRDAAQAFVAALHRGNPGERHLMGAVNWDFDEFFARLGRIAHRQPPLWRMPSPLKVAAAHWLEKWARDRGREPDLPASDVEMGECWFFIDSSKSERLLGFRPRDPVETLADTVRYVRENFVARGA
jgi:dihydroflavonol-4-reductase